MKKLISLFIVSLVLLVPNYTSANEAQLEKKLYKMVILTSKDVKKHYGEKVNSKIVSIFKDLRHKKDTTKLKALEELLSKKIVELKNQKNKTLLEENKLNLYNNLFYRTKLLLDYNLK